MLFRSLGGKYYCKADNVDPGACLTRADGSSKAEAERAALAQAEKCLGQFRRVGAGL